MLSYNVHGQRDDVAALAAAVRAAEPDVVIVQEGPRRFRWRHKTRARWPTRFGLVVGAGGLPSLGNLVLTSLRVRVQRTWHRAVPAHPGPAHARCGRSPNAPSVRDVAPFVVAGSHLATDPTERPGQAALLKRDAGRAATAGDRSAPTSTRAPAAAAWRTVADGLTDAAVATGRADRLTFPCADPR